MMKHGKGGSYQGSKIVPCKSQGNNGTCDTKKPSRKMGGAAKSTKKFDVSY
jgi:hypothetical protein